jgi:hypothetical protein
MRTTRSIAAVVAIAVTTIATEAVAAGNLLLVSGRWDNGNETYLLALRPKRP